MVTLPGGRSLAVDDIGDPRGVPVVYLHGTPDSRLSRHPDDRLVATLGVRLLAVDRPGYGASDPPPATNRGTRESPMSTFGDDLVALLDHLEIESCCVLAWSGGALAALAAAAAPAFARRLSVLGLVGAVVPHEAFQAPAVRAAAPERLNLFEFAGALPEAELVDAVAPLIAPYPCDHELAAEHQATQRDDVARAEVASVPRASERLADGLVEAVRRGLSGVAADVAAQVRPLDVDLGTLQSPVRLWYGELDTVTPPEFGRWYAEHIPGADLHVVAGAGHYVMLTRWANILSALIAAPA